MISRELWLAALRDAEGPSDPEAVTVRELAAMLGVSRPTAYEKVAALIAQGKARPTKKLTMRSDGHPMTVTAYRLIQEEAS